MTGTSRALRRLGVAGLSVVVMSTGMTALTAVAANAATVNNQATALDLKPDTDAATVDTCNPFTATITPAPGAGNNYTFTVTLSQPANAATQTPTSTTIGFCDVTNFTEATGKNPQAAPAATAGSGGGGAFSAAPNNPTASTCNAQSALQASPGTLTCKATFTTDANGVATFGVTSNTAGTMSVQAFVDKNGNGVLDSGLGEPNDTSTKTWNAKTAGSIACTPASDTNPAGTAHNFSCTVTTGANGAGTPVPDQAVKFTITGGPDASNTIYSCTEDAAAKSTGTYGKYNCGYTNNGVTGTDTIVVWVDSNGNGGKDSTEPTTTISKSWVAPAPANATVVATCSPNATNSTSTICQDPTTDGKATFTATVTNNNTSPATPAAGVIVNWSIAQSGGAVDATDTESLSASSCTTDSSGKCSVNFTDSTPGNGESWTATASVPRQSGGDATASATKNFHTPTADEARTIDVTPATASQPSGGAQAFTATVKDRFNNPVNGVTVNWTESGPGGFRSGSQCTTGTTGTCTIEVTSLSTETGSETVTATIGTPTASSECASPAGYSNYTAGTSTGPGTANNGGATPNAGGQNNVAPGTTAGACSDSGTVTWKAATPPPTVKKQHPYLNCWSPRAHVLKCRVVSHPRVQGATVKFRKVHRDGTFGKIIAVRTTDASGVAKFKKRHLRSGKLWRVIAHVGRVGNVRGGYSNVDKTRIK